MNGKIDKSGSLLIGRSGKMVTQQCPFGPLFCGDWCSLFGEPDKNTDAYTYLCLCKTTLEFDTFTDERGT